jgi:uncharacterized protein (TIGR03435 family)
MFRAISATTLIGALFCHPITYAQSATSLEFDVASIKRNTTPLGAGGGLGIRPDGTFIMTNQPIQSIILNASPVPVREVVGVPDWVNTERYDVTVKPPVGSTREQWSQMWQALFADRMKLVAHVERRERTTFALVLARGDGRLGSQLQPSTLDCSSRPGPSAPPPQAATSANDVRNRCGMTMNATSIMSGSITMDRLAQSLGGLAGGLVNNGTGLQGTYALTLTFSRTRGAGAPNAGALDDPPEIFTALQEQLGLKLRPERTMVPIFVVDHIERPSEN